MGCAVVHSVLLNRVFRLVVHHSGARRLKTPFDESDISPTLMYARIHMGREDDVGINQGSRPAFGIFISIE